ncbi:OadG family protein [Lachnoclostridium sp. Marseille-P6806]|uniref:OadG family protein n=1 Tax=Lachnoclostridium sp. Marseille-P6806 TaxID=2364793 RepID=UPI0013EF14C9|nr:OadG family protein [Lachnoclostridium sp. Marseille-P6806]
MKKRFSILTAVIACVLSFMVLSANVRAAGMYDALTEEQAVQYGQQLVQQIAELEKSGQTAQYEDGGVFSGAFDSWETAMETLKSYQGLSDAASATISADSLVINIGILGENNRTATVTISADESGQYTSISVSADETFSEKMEHAALNTVLGMGMAFFVLILIALVIKFAFPPIAAFGKRAEEKKNAPAAKAAAPAASASGATAVTAAPAEELTDDGELVAVIAAAIAADSRTGTDGFVVRSIRRAGRRA